MCCRDCFFSNFFNEEWKYQPTSKRLVARKWFCWDWLDFQCPLKISTVRTSSIHTPPPLSSHALNPPQVQEKIRQDASSVRKTLGKSTSTEIFKGVNNSSPTKVGKMSFKSFFRAWIHNLSIVEITSNAKKKLSKSFPWNKKRCHGVMKRKCCL